MLPKLWEGFIHPHIDRMNKFFAGLVRTGELAVTQIIIYWFVCFAGKSSLSL